MKNSYYEEIKNEIQKDFSKTLLRIKRVFVFAVIAAGTIIVFGIVMLVQHWMGGC